MMVMVMVYLGVAIANEFPVPKTKHYEQFVFFLINFLNFLMC
jgi:hypothetical protein